ncbi:TPA: hypothetical protein ACH3X1_011954 [Trebouxia sp. C0004]
MILKSSKRFLSHGRRSDSSAVLEKKGRGRGKTQYYMRAIIQFIFAYWARNEDGTGLIFSSDIKSMSTEDPKGKAYKASVGLTQAWIMHDCKIRNESCPPLLGGVGSLKTEIQKRLSAQMKKPDPFRDDTTDGAKQWAQFHETGVLNSDYFKLPAAQKPSQKPSQKQHPSASQPAPPTAQMFAVNHAALSETGPPAQKDAGRDPELEDLGLVSPGSMLNQSDAPPTWEDFTQRLQDQKTDDTATSPGEKRKQANKENKPEPSKVDLKRKKSGLPEQRTVWSATFGWRQSAARDHCQGPVRSWHDEESCQYGKSSRGSGCGQQDQGTIHYGTVLPPSNPTPMARP